MDFRNREQINDENMKDRRRKKKKKKAKRNKAMVLKEVGWHMVTSV